MSSPTAVYVKVRVHVLTSGVFPLLMPKNNLAAGLNIGGVVAPERRHEITPTSSHLSHTLRSRAKGTDLKMELLGDNIAKRKTDLLQKCSKLAAPPLLTTFCSILYFKVDLINVLSLHLF